MKINELEKQLRKLENLLANHEKKKSFEKLNKIISDEFIEFGASGRIYNKKSVIETLQNTSAEKILLSDFKLILLSESVALVIYKAIKNMDSKEKKYCSLRSSIWKKNKDKWEIIFHQGTLR